MEWVEDKLERLADIRVLVVGDVMLDRYWFGSVDRISPEAPVPVVSVDSTEERIGGAGNVSCNVTALRGQSTLLGIVGKDEAGERVDDLARACGVTSALVVDENIKTTIKLRVISRNQQLLRADFETSPGVNALNRSMKQFEELIDQHDIVVLSDYAKGGLGRIEQMIEMANRHDKPVLVDPKGSQFERYRGATMITPNLKEFEAVVGEADSREEMGHKAAALIEALEISKLLITLSEKGVVLFNRQSTAMHRVAKTHEVYDVSGAGDTVIAVMAMALATGLNDADSLELANTAAGIVVSKLGTATVGMEELKVALQQGKEMQ